MLILKKNVSIDEGILHSKKLKISIVVLGIQ